MCEPKVTVVRDSKESEIGVNDIVLDDIIKYKLGKLQITKQWIMQESVRNTSVTAPHYHKKLKNTNTCFSTPYVYDSIHFYHLMI